MTLKIYRIDRSFFGKMNNKFKAPDLPVMAASIIGNPFKNLADFNRENSYVLSKDDEIARFNEAFGNDWVDDRYYIRHPKKSKTDVLIPSERFYQYIVREQIGDIISYIRANVRVKKLEISLLRGANVGVGLKGIVEGIELEGAAKASCNSEYSVIIDCDRPLKASEKKLQYIWIDEFQHLQAMIDETSESRFEIKEQFDLSFGLSVKAAKAVGLNADFNTTHLFSVNVTTA
jgi:hypothetical protein